MSDAKVLRTWDDDDCVTGAMDELAARFGWSPEACARLSRLHAAFDALEGPAQIDGSGVSQ